MDQMYDASGKVVVPRKAWSFSVLDKFYKCPRKYYFYDISKEIKEPENDAMREGFIVHKAMADYINTGKPLPQGMERYADWVTTTRTGKPGEIVLTEQKFACTFKLKPCDYYSRIDKVWLRAQADYVVINGPDALSIDWKTGKVPEEGRFEDTLPKNFQLCVSSFLIFLNYPQVQTVTNRYVYLSQGQASLFEMKRGDLREFVPQMYELAAGLQQAVKSNVWPPHPSGLCKKHCAVTQCQYHGIGG